MTEGGPKPPVVVLSGIRWDFLWQRHQILSTRFARAGYPTVFVETTGLSTPKPSIETLRKVAARLRGPSRSAGSGSGSGAKTGQPNLAVYSPLVAPPTRSLFRQMNRRFFVPRVVRDLKKLAGRSPLVVAYPPTRTTLDIISGLEPRLLLYDCADDYEGFPGAPHDVAATERGLLRRADLVSCTSTPLLEKVRPARPDAFLSGPGVDYELFAPLQGPQPDGTRTVAFFGHLGRERVDFEAIRAVAGAGFEVRLVGDAGRADRTVLGMPGVDYRGEVAHRELPAALEGVDAFIIPYKINRLTRGISPAKTYECLATGKPVVAAPLPALEELGDHVYLARKPEEFVEVLRGLENLEAEEKRRARLDLTRRNSWEARFADLEERIRRAL